MAIRVNLSDYSKTSGTRWLETADLTHISAETLGLVAQLVSAITEEYVIRKGLSEEEARKVTLEDLNLFFCTCPTTNPDGPNGNRRAVGIGWFASSIVQRSLHFSPTGEAWWMGEIISKVNEPRDKDTGIIRQDPPDVGRVSGYDPKDIAAIYGEDMLGPDLRLVETQPSE